MENYSLIFSKDAKKQMKHDLKSAPRSTRNNINRTLEQLKNDPSCKAVGSKPIPRIKQGGFSKQVSKGDRIVYVIIEVTKVVVVLSILGHYCDNGGRLF